MLSIRPDQLKVFSKYLLEGFRERMVQRISENHPKRFAELGKPGALALVDRVLKDALPAGIRKDRDVAALLDVLLQAGPRSEEKLGQPWAKKILAAPSLPGATKVRLLSRTLTAPPPQTEKEKWETI